VKHSVSFSILIVTFVLSILSNLVSPSLSQYLVEALKNYSFEERGSSVYSVLNWSSNNGGWRNLKGDVNGDGKTNLTDLVLIQKAFGSRPGDPNWNPNADLNGDKVVNNSDLIICSGDFGKPAYNLDGFYSWYTNGGGDYMLVQWLDMDTVILLAEETVRFSFYFYPESVASDGSQNNARAEIYYEYASGSNTVYGIWVTPTVLNWYNAYVTVTLPSTTFAIAVIIHGRPDFKAWVDSAHLTTYGYNLYYTLPPYDNQGSYGTTYGDRLTGQASSYSSASPPVLSDSDYVQFNMDPPPGNSPQVYQEGDGFYVRAYWEAYGYLGSDGAASSSVSIILYLYSLRIGYGWELVTTYTFTISPVEHPNQEIYYFGPLSQWISSPPSGSRSYAIGVRISTSAASVGGSAWANFYSYPYYTFIHNVKMSD